MSVTNRKLFNRGARDELRKKGGIMASSEPMMQSVGYETGGAIDAFIQGGRFLQDNPFILDYLAKAAAGTGIAGIASVPAFFLKEKLNRDKKIRDYYKAEGGVVGYENGGGVLSNIFNYLRTPDEENPMLQLIQNTIDPSTSAPDDPRISDELMQYLASQKPRLQGGAVPGGSFPTIDSQNSVFKMPPINALPYQPRPPQDTERDDIGDMIVAEKGPTSDEGIRARVAESAAQGKSAAETADELGMYIQDVLDVGVGFIGSGILEGTAFALDVASAIESGIVGNRAAGEMYAGGARNVKGFSDETFYNKGDSLPRVSSIFSSKDEEQNAAEQERLDAIRQASLANIGSADMEGADTGVFADTGDSIPVSSDSLGQEAIKERIISDYLGREPIKVGRTFPTGSRLNQFGGQLNRPDDMALYSSDSDLVRQGVASILPGLVNEPPAEVPQTIEQKIANTLANIATGGVEKAGEFFEGGTEYLEGLISGDDTPVATELSGIQEKQRQDAIRKYLGEESEYQIPGIVDDVDKGYFDTNRVKEDNFGSRDSLYFNIDPIASDVNKRALEYLQSDMYIPPEEIYSGDQRGEKTVSEELMETSKNVFPVLKEKVVTILNNLTEKESAPEIDKGEASTGQNNTPVIKEDEKVLEVKEPEKPDAPAFSEKVITTIKNDRGFDPVSTGIVENFTNRDLADMSGDQDDVTDDESFESYVNKYVKQYQELFKEDEDQIRKDKGFAMAIFGSVYASTGDFGQASAAMIDMLRGDKATRQAREDKVKMLAINSAADRKAADLRYKREIDVASARGGSSIYGKRTDPLTQTYRLTSDFLDAGDYDTYNEAFEAAKKQVEKEYGISLGASGDIEKPDPKIQEMIQNLRDNKVSDEVIKKQLEDAAEKEKKTINLTMYGF
jgi:hypothetical protein